jgi:hypothetical protein
LQQKHYNILEGFIFKPVVNSSVAIFSLFPLVEFSLELVLYLNKYKVNCGISDSSITARYKFVKCYLAGPAARPRAISFGMARKTSGWVLSIVHRRLESLYLAAPRAISAVGSPLAANNASLKNAFHTSRTPLAALTIARYAWLICPPIRVLTCGLLPFALLRAGLVLPLYQAILMGEERRGDMFDKFVGYWVRKWDLL